MRQKLPPSAFLFPTALLLILFLTNTTIIRSSMQEALLLSYLSVVPSVFPFSVLSGYLMGTLYSGNEPAPLRMIGVLLGLPAGGGSCFLLGALCGFPLGARCVADGYRNGLFSKKEAERMLMFCNNTGPAFLVGGVGSMFGSTVLGWSLYAIQLSLSVLTAVVTRRKAQNKLPVPKLSSPVSFVSCVSKGVDATLTVLGFVLFFSACIGILEAYLPSFLLLPLACLMEISSAANLASAVPYGAVWAAFAVCFSGASVHLQSAAVMSDTDLSMLPYLLGKCLQGLLGGMLAFVIFCH